MFSSRSSSSLVILYSLNSWWYIDLVNLWWYLEASLSGVEPLMQKIHNEIRRVDAGILAAVRQQVIFVSFFPGRKQKLSFIILLVCSNFPFFWSWVHYVMSIQQLDSHLAWWVFRFICTWDDSNVESTGTYLIEKVRYFGWNLNKKCIY